MEVRLARHRNPDVHYSMNAVLKGHAAIEKSDMRGAAALGSEVKPDDTMGHHSIVTPSDYVSQDAMLGYLLRHIPKRPIITEERTGASSARILKVDDLEELREALRSKDGVFVTDPLCGTSPHATGLVDLKGRFIGGSYAVTAGNARLDENGLYVYGGAVYDGYKGGILYYGSRYDGTKAVIGGHYLSIGDMHVRFGGHEVQSRVVHVPKLKDAVVIFNPDVMLPDKYPALYKAAGDISPRFRTSYTLESCGGSMGRVATGWAHGLVHAPISPEHWIGGVAIIEGAGGVVIPFVSDESGKVVRLEKLGLDNMLPGVRSTGFVAGSPKMAEDLMTMLIESSRKS